ncbi:hypothetical protein KBC40_02125 [Patescibacteria group bacterium]|nr:hypothetical protein [Patescibacteria group bacterium]
MKTRGALIMARTLPERGLVEFWIQMAWNLGDLQHQLNAVQRWVRPDDAPHSVPVTNYHFGWHRRPQWVPQHLLEAQEICNLFIVIFRQHLQPFDEHLLREAVRVHDFGEAIHCVQGHDVILANKRDEHDLDEWLYFTQYLERTYPNMQALQEEMKRAFLLQFCLKGNSLLPAEIMEDLQNTRGTEALLFEAIERWGYLLYALEQWHAYQNRDVLLNVLGNNRSHFDRLSRDLPGFGEEIWEQEMKSFCAHIMTLPQ